MKKYRLSTSNQNKKFKNNCDKGADCKCCPEKKKPDSCCSCERCSVPVTAIPEKKEDRGKLFIIFLSAALLIFGIAVEKLYPSMYILTSTMFLLAYIVCGGEFIIKAFKNILKGEIFDENFLMVLATACAIALGEFSEAVAVMLFYSVGEYFQDLAVARTKTSISELMNLRPDFANVLRDGKEVRIDPSEVNIGDLLVIKPGEKVPVDCTVTEGTAYMDTVSLTGESLPRSVSKGSALLSGIIDTDGVLTARADKVYSESTSSKILKLVETSASRKAKAENFITKFAKIYTPVVVGLAAILAFVPPIFSGYTDFSQWLYRALVFLIISCPCAVVISVPLGFFGGIGGASKLGILFKGANYFDALSETEVMVLDKTGTLTKGTFSVTAVSPMIPFSESELIKTAALCERYSSHPIAQSLKEKYGENLENTSVSAYREHSGKGVTAEIEGVPCAAGNALLMEELGIKFQKAAENGTVVYVASAGQFSGYIVISDEIKEGAYNLVKDLKGEGVKTVIMLTGDNKESAQYIAEKTGVDKYRFGLLPQQKVEIVEEIKKEYGGKIVAFAGDGINDAPVLARSDVGIAMGAMGSDAAIESADVVLLGDNIGDIVTAIKAAKRTRRIVLQNIVFSIAFKILFLALGAVGIANIWMAVFADVGVALLAVLNSSRALSVKNLRK